MSMSRLICLFASGVFSCLAAASCSSANDEQVATAGTVGNACGVDDTCNAGLVCNAQNVCVAAGFDTKSDGGLSWPAGDSTARWKLDGAGGASADGSGDDASGASDAARDGGVDGMSGSDGGAAGDAIVAGDGAIGAGDGGTSADGGATDALPAQQDAGNAERRGCAARGACNEIYFESAAAEPLTREGCQAKCAEQTAAHPDRRCFWGADVIDEGTQPSPADCCPTTACGGTYGRKPHGFYDPTRRKMPGSHNDCWHYKCTNGTVSCEKERNKC